MACIFFLMASIFGSLFCVLETHGVTTIQIGGENEFPWPLSPSSRCARVPVAPPIFFFFEPPLLCRLVFPPLSIHLLETLLSHFQASSVGVLRDRVWKEESADNGRDPFHPPRWEEEEHNTSTLQHSRVNGGLLGYWGGRREMKSKDLLNGNGLYSGFLRIWCLWYRERKKNIISWGKEIVVLVADIRISRHTYRMNVHELGWNVRNTMVSMTLCPYMW